MTKPVLSCVDHQTLPKSSIYIPSAMDMSSVAPLSLQIMSVFDFGFSDGNVVVFCCFNRSLVICDVECLFLYWYEKATKEGLGVFWIAVVFKDNVFGKNCFPKNCVAYVFIVAVSYAEEIL